MAKRNEVRDDEQFMREFAIRLRTVRESRGLSIAEAARQSQVSELDWQLWESGKDSPEMTPFVRICDSLRADINWLAGVPSAKG